MNNERKVYEVMKDLGANMSLKGYRYASYVVTAMLDGDIDSTDKMIYIYDKIATKFKDTPSRVERALRHFIENMFSELPPAKIDKYFGEGALRAYHDKLPNGQFIIALYEYIKFNGDDAE